MPSVLDDYFVKQHQSDLKLAPASVIAWGCGQSMLDDLHACAIRRWSINAIISNQNDVGVQLLKGLCECYQTLQNNENATEADILAAIHGVNFNMLILGYICVYRARFP
jgi:hypothetical protein